MYRLSSFSYCKNSENKRKKAAANSLFVGHRTEKRKGSLLVNVPSDNIGEAIKLYDEATLEHGMGNGLTA